MLPTALPNTATLANVATLAAAAAHSKVLRDKSGTAVTPTAMLLNAAVLANEAILAVAAARC